MPYIILGLREFFAEKEILRFLKCYIPTILVLIFLRYQLFTSWEWRTFQNHYYALYYTLPFLLTIFCISFYVNRLKDLKFWLFCLGLLMVVQLNHFVRVYDFYFSENFTQGTSTYFMRLFYNVQCSLTYLILPVACYFTAPISALSFWGLSFNKPILKPYCLILVMVLPILWLASWSAHFREVYPLFLTGSPDILAHYSFFKTFLLFQFFYVLQFITLEIFFRGFLVLKGKEYLGKYSVFLMATLYVLIHLEAKPMLESIGSLFGGLVLGAIAFQTRQIWGGILVHVGIALAMELLALI